MHRRAFLRLSALSGALALTPPAAVTGRPMLSFPARNSASVADLGIRELQTLMAANKLTALALTKEYLARIEALDRRGPRLNSVIELNPDALAIASALDRERKTGTIRGPMHGIPVLVKDNIDTHDRMTTTSGSLALAGSIPLRDAFIVERLRRAGAVLLGKTNLSEWANFRGSRSTSGWSARGGQTRNPYVLDRNPSGSSSGSAVGVSASLCTVAVGTETDGSILSPASYNGIVGIKPTLGLISRSGIIPIAHSQDTAGPMARSVMDAAICLGALAGRDARDSATALCETHAEPDYTYQLRPGNLNGCRLGIARHFLGAHKNVDGLSESAMDTMESLGATLVDAPELKRDPDLSAAEIEVLRYEMKADMNAYLASLGPNAPVRNLQEIIEFNERNAEVELRWFGQEELIRSQEKGPLSERAYLDALATCRRLARTEGIDATMDKHSLDAILAPTSTPAHVTDWITGDNWLGDSTSPAAVAGYPSITVPMGYVCGLPVGISFFGRPWTEAKLLRIAYAFEQAVNARMRPRFITTLAAETEGAR